MRVEYDKETDAAYIYLRELGAGEAVHTRTLPRPSFVGLEDKDWLWLVNLDFDKDAKLVGIEAIPASHILPKELLEG